MAVTWDPNLKSSGITLSNGNKTAQGENQNQRVCSTTHKSAGKYYCELLIGTAGDRGVFGIVPTSDVDYDSGFGYNEGQGGGYFYQALFAYNGEGVNAYGTTWGAGAVIGMAVDFDAGRLEYFRNGTSQGVAKTGATFGDCYVSYCGYIEVTARFAAADFTYAPPTGYSAWDSGGGTPVSVTVDTTRTSLQSASVPVDTRRQTSGPASVTVDTLRSTSQTTTVSVAVDTSRRTGNQWPVSVSIDTARAMRGAVSVHANTLRKRGVTMANCLLLNVSLQSGVLSDKYSMTYNSAQALGKRWLSNIFGWFWAAKAQQIQITKTKTGNLDRWQVTAGYDVEDLLRKPISFPGTLTGAKDIMNHVADQLGKTPRLYFDDFSIKAVTDTPTVTDIVGRLFSWSNQIPTMKISVFLRNTEIWAVQRGKEPGTYTLDKTQNGEATVNQEYIYTLNSAADSAGNAKQGSIPLDYESVTEFLSGSFPGPGGSLINVETGLTTRETVVTDAETTTTTYSYSNSKPPAQMTRRVTEITGSGYSKTITATWAFSNTSVSYGSISCETIETTETKDGATKNLPTQKTYYSPRGDNAYAVSAFVDGKLISGQVCMGRPPNGAASVVTSNDSRARRPEKITSAELLNDYNLPFTDSATIDIVVAEIERLDGLIVDSVSLPSWDHHVVDFNECITYDGATYYLDANRIEVVPTLTTQSLNLTRVY